MKPSKEERGSEKNGVVDGDSEITGNDGEHELKVKNGIQGPVF